MKRAPLTNWMSFNNILYIGDEAKECLGVIEKFNQRLSEIEQHYKGWFIINGNEFQANDKLQRHIQYHFEGGMAIFKFKNEDALPDFIRRECLIACRSLAFEQLCLTS